MKTIKEMFNKIKEIKHIEIYLVIIIAAIVLFVYISNTMVKKNEENLDKKEQTVEEKIETILSKIEGVGKCNVLITYKSKEIVTSSDATITKIEENGYSSYVSSSTNTPVIISSNGKSDVLYTEGEQIYGVIVVCEGGNDAMVIAKITSAIKTLLDVNGLNIQVYKSY